jgi:REP element-mobilizing transposase RayT
LPGASFLVTRRCTQREFLLLPSPVTNHLFKYVLAVAAERYGVLIHAVCVMSNHVHLVVTDPRAALPDFTHLLDGVVAKALNGFFERKENFWAPSSYNAVELIEPEDVVEKVAYTLANPASAGLVEHGRQWPGVWSDPCAVDQPGELIERPARFFSKKGSMPATAVLKLSTPPGFQSADQFRARVLARIDELETAAAAERGAAGLTVLGVRGLAEQKHTDRPTSREPRRALIPRIAAGCKATRDEALARLLSFFRSHRDAVVRFCRGERSVVFPRGTYLMRVRYGVACAGG